MCVGCMRMSSDSCFSTVLSSTFMFDHDLSRLRTQASDSRQRMSCNRAHKHTSKCRVQYAPEVLFGEVVHHVQILLPQAFGKVGEVGGSDSREGVGAARLTARGGDGQGGACKQG